MNITQNTINEKRNQDINEINLLNKYMIENGTIYYTNKNKN